MYGKKSKKGMRGSKKGNLFITQSPNFQSKWKSKEGIQRFFPQEDLILFSPF